jgi:hypothetical protein
MYKLLGLGCILAILGCKYTSDDPVKPAPLPPVPPVKITVDQARQLIQQNDLEKIVHYLASPELKGRMTGKPGNRTTADFIEYRYKQLKLTTGRQKFNSQYGETENVYAILPGKLKECICIVAHFDHIGATLSLARDRVNRDHLGADDNASGTAIVLELAEAFSALRDNNYTLIFLNVTAEEFGLWGSKHYVNNPVRPLSDTVLCVNFDMDGRLRNNNLMVFGANIFPEFPTYLAERYDLNLNTGMGSGGSDHASFANKNIPYLFFHTGLHSDYHTVKDTADKINYPGLTTVSKFAFDVIIELDRKANEMVMPMYLGPKLDITHDHGVIEW